MTKINKTKLALLGATAFLGATTAQAQVADTWAINGEILVTATNTAETTSLDPVTGAAVVGIDGATITTGFRNSISGSAVGSSASSSFTSVNNSAVGGAAELAIDGTVTVAAGNAAAILNNTDVITGATISAGSANSISLAAVGSSASISANSTLTDVGGGAVEGDETFAYSAGALVVSSGNADGSTDASAGSLDGGNEGTVTLTLASGVNVPVIEAGFGNSISVAGVGSSASASFAATVGGDGSVLDSSTVTLADGAGISAANSADGVVQVNLTEAGLVTPAINGGNANSISAAAVGSSASFSLASGTFGGGVITAFNAEIGELIVNSTNGENTISLAGVDGDGQTAMSEAAISGLGNGNSISASAVGSSGSVSYANTVYSVGGGAAGGDVTFAAITVNSTNGGTITNNTDLTTSGAIDGGSRNSISIAGVGASASQSLSITDYSGAGVTGVNTVAEGGITLAALNTGVVSVSGGLSNPAIADGFSNSISAAAVGASASQSVSRTLVGVVQ